MKVYWIAGHGTEYDTINAARDHADSRVAAGTLAYPVTICAGWPAELPHQDGFVSGAHQVESWFGRDDDDLHTEVTWSLQHNAPMPDGVIVRS